MSALEQEAAIVVARLAEKLSQMASLQDVSAQPDAITPTSPLLESGLMDSLGVFDVVAFIDSAFGVTVPQEALVPANFRTCNALAGMVMSLKCQGT